MEKALNQQGTTTGQLGQRQYLGAVYMFEATISEASVGERSNSFTVGVAGATAGHGRSKRFGGHRCANGRCGKAALWWTPVTALPNDRGG